MSFAGRHTKVRAPAVSIITPTANRERMLPALARCVMRQTVDWEWLIHDDSPRPSMFLQDLAGADARVRYFHNSNAPLSIGAKRNWLVERARGPLIAHFDDDDHYASRYLAEMTGLLHRQAVDVIKLSEFYMFAPRSGFFGYMDLHAKVGRHFALTGDTITPVEFHDKRKIGADFILFYGYSYVYKRALLELARFDDVDLCEDESFVRKIVEADRAVAAVDDRNGTALHIVHPGSTSRCFARYELPAFLLPRLFPEYEGYPV